AAANDPISVAVANTAADQLRNVGVAATVAALDPPVLYGSALAGNRIDAIVGWHAAGGDLATALSSRFGCPALESAPVPATPPSADGAPARPGPTAPTRPGAAPDAAPLVRAPSNLTGVCDRGIQAQIDAALNGSRPVEEVLAAVEPKLWAMSTVLPIMQDTTIVAAGPTVKNVALSGAVPVGIVGDAGTWVKTAQ
ncbi:MAG TPA: ABC transporter family substrate-binding protein, partial [Mycobacterium sp.]|nr:ABC transporter family substrate-binding protein [Mycobacterium sp.]